MNFDNWFGCAWIIKLQVIIALVLAAKPSKKANREELNGEIFIMQISHPTKGRRAWSNFNHNRNVRCTALVYLGELWINYRCAIIMRICRNKKSIYRRLLINYYWSEANCRLLVSGENMQIARHSQLSLKDALKACKCFRNWFHWVICYNFETLLCCDILCAAERRSKTVIDILFGARYDVMRRIMRDFFNCYSYSQSWIPSWHCYSNLQSFPTNNLKRLSDRFMQLSVKFTRLPKADDLFELLSFTTFKIC